MSKDLEKFYSIVEDLECIGLIRERNELRGPFTPNEAFIFANLGTDSVHFCLIPRTEDKNNLDDASVYVVDPCDSEHAVELVARSLTDFLNLVVKTKSASNLLYSCLEDEDEFYGCKEEIQESLDENPQLRREVKGAIYALNKTFKFENIPNLFNHISETRLSDQYTSKYTFSDEYYEIIG